MKKIILLKIILSIFVILSLLTSCYTYSTNRNDVIKLGVSFPLTGEAASIGIGAKAGIDLALKEINDQGGINGKLIEVIYEDDTCSKQGINALTKLASIDKVDAIIGPICSSAAGPGLPIAQQYRIPSLIIATDPSLTDIGDYIFRIYPSDSFAGNFVAHYLFDNLGKKKVAVFYVDNSWGQNLRNVFVKRYQEFGGEIVFDESITNEAIDVKTQIEKIKLSRAEYVYTPLYPKVGIVFAKQAQELGISIPVIGGDTWETPEFVTSGYTNGLFYTTGKLNNPESFKMKIRNDFGVEPNSITPIAYDSVNILVKIWREVGTDKEDVRGLLTQLEYEGISNPLISFDEKGDLKYADYVVMRIKDDHATRFN